MFSDRTKKKKRKGLASEVVPSQDNIFPAKATAFQTVSTGTSIVESPIIDNNYAANSGNNTLGTHRDYLMYDDEKSDDLFRVDKKVKEGT